MAGFGAQTAVAAGTEGAALAAERERRHFQLESAPFLWLFGGNAEVNAASGVRS